MEDIADNTFMVVHGTADDNVHVHHTMVLSKVLVQNHIIFRQQVSLEERRMQRRELSTYGRNTSQSMERPAGAPLQGNIE